MQVVLGRIEAHFRSGWNSDRECRLAREQGSAARRAARNARRIEGKSVDVTEIDNVRECRRKPGFFVQLSRSGGGRRFAELATAGERLPETAARGNATEEQDFRVAAHHRDRHGLELGGDLRQLALPNGGRIRRRALLHLRHVRRAIAQQHAQRGHRCVVDAARHDGGEVAQIGRDIESESM